ncbi:MAG: SIMPL domain-containing protein [Pseudomonadota bacterium]
MIHNVFKATALALAAATASLMPVHAANIEIEAEGPVIELRITESFEAEPDVVTIGAGVSTDAATAVEALRANSLQMQSVIDQIKALAVDAKDIQTTGINLNARYEYERPANKRRFVGYTASNRVSVTLRKIEGTGEALDALVAAGATDLSGPSFSVEDDTAAKAQARARAFERAKTRVEEYAALLDYDTYRVLEINESVQGRSPIYAESLRAVRSDVAAAPPVEPGLVSTGVSITIKYELLKDEATEE